VALLREEDVIRGIWPFLRAERVTLLPMVLFPALGIVTARWFTGSPRAPLRCLALAALVHHE
jgi:hypothetical protein